MSEKFKKIDKEFCITDDSVNVYGYRCLSAGLLLDEVKKNPIGYYMHGTTEEYPRDLGVLVRWEDFRTDKDKVYAKPCINLSHPRGQRTVDEVESGFLNAASVGKITVLEASKAKNLMLPKQDKATVTKWFPREISLVDIPGNYSALANLYDKNDNELNLSDLENFTIKNMSNILNATLILAALNLKDGDEGEVVTAINNLVAKADLADGYKKDLDEKETELKDLKAAGVKKEVEDLIDKGENDKKITVEVGKQLRVAYAENPKGLKDLIDAMPAQVSVTEEIKDKDKELAKYEGKSWDDLYASEELPIIQKKFPDLYEKLRNEKFPNLKA